MITYRYDEERVVALYFANLLQDNVSKEIIKKGEVNSKDEATHISKFFWKMVDVSSSNSPELPCEGSSKYWLEKLYNSIGGYLEKTGYENQWNQEIDNA